MAEENGEAEVTAEPAEFFCVWTKQGRFPRFTHNTRPQATSEAKRLARLHPGRKFFVLEARAKYHVPTEA